MATDIAKPTVEIRDWNGIMTGVDARDIPDGAATLQINAVCIVPGELMPRRGLRPVVFDEEPTLVAVVISYLLGENGDALLLENGDQIIMG